MDLGRTITMGLAFADRMGNQTKQWKGEGGGRLHAPWRGQEEQAGTVRNFIWAGLAMTHACVHLSAPFTLAPPYVDRGSMIQPDCYCDAPPDTSQGGTQTLACNPQIRQDAKGRGRKRASGRASKADCERGRGRKESRFRKGEEEDHAKLVVAFCRTGIRAAQLMTSQKDC